MAVFLISLDLAASSVRAESKTSGKPKPAVVPKSQEPAVLKAIIAAHWRLETARAALPPVQVIHNEHLEIEDWIEHAYDGGALRLYVSPGPNGGDIFAVLVGTREPRYGNFAQLTSTEQCTIYHRGPYVVVVPVHPVSQKLFDTLKAKRWTEEELQQQLGAFSYHWHVHGVGWLGLTYVPQGLSFTGDSEGRNSPVMYQVHDEDAEAEMGMKGATLPPPELLSKLDYAKLQRKEREEFADRLFNQRDTIDQALARGKRSADGRFVVGTVNIVGLRSTTEVAIRETGRPEQRSYPGAAIIQDHQYWLNAHTVVYEVESDAGDKFGWNTIDALTGEITDIAGRHDTVATDFGVSGPDRFWYKSADGEKREVTVTPHEKR